MRLAQLPLVTINDSFCIVRCPRGRSYYTCNISTCSDSNRNRNFYEFKNAFTSHLRKFHDVPSMADDFSAACSTSFVTNQNVVSKAPAGHGDICLLVHSYDTSTQIGQYFLSNYPKDGTGFNELLQLRACTHLLLKASHQTDGEILHNLIDKIPLNSFKLFFSVAQIAINSDDNVIHHLSLLLKHFVPIWKKESSCLLNFPTSSASFQKMITSSRNAHSLRENLPIPQLKMLNAHSYSPLLSLLGYSSMCQSPGCISNHHQHRVESRIFLEFCRRLDVRASRSISSRPIIAVQLVFWSDGFDPNCNKNNRRGAWIMTVTFLFYQVIEGSPKLYMVETCLVSCGPGKGMNESEDHSEVFIELREDLKQLYYDGNPVCFSFVSRAHGGLLCDFYTFRECKHFYDCINDSVVDQSDVYLMDNPERRANFGLLAGNSKNHACFGLSCNFANLQKPFEACDACAGLVSDYCKSSNWKISPPQPTCNNCHGFSLPHLLKEGKYKEPEFVLSSPEMSEEDLPGYHLFGSPGKLDNKTLRDAYVTARDFFIDGKLSKSQVEDYLSVMCYNKKTIDNLIKGSRLYCLLQEVETGSPDVTVDDKEEIAAAKKISRNGTIEKPQPPAMLDICDLNFATETIMHGSMNSVKHLTRTKFAWAKGASNYSCHSMIEEAQAPIKSVGSLHLSEFPALLFKTEKMGGYVAENYRTYLHLSPWMFHHIDEHESSLNQFSAVASSSSPTENWCRADIRNWLLMRGVNSNQRMTRKELLGLARQTVHDPVVRDLVDASGKEIQEMIAVLNCFLSSVFSCDLKGADALHRCMGFSRYYLSLVSKMDAHLGHKTKSWLSSYSLIGFLRIPDLYRIIPYPICLYEGDGMGEGIVKEIRPLTLTGLREGWASSCHSKYYRKKSLSTMEELLFGAGEHFDNRSIRCRLKMYSDFESVKLIIGNSKPFSFSVFTESLTGIKCLCVVVKNHDYNALYRLDVAHAASLQETFGYSYYPVSQEGQLIGDFTDLSKMITSTGYTYKGSGVALPRGTGTYAFLLGNGSKKVDGLNHPFSPSGINLRSHD